jgi:hypothetical protein
MSRVTSGSPPTSQVIIMSAASALYFSRTECPGGGNRKQPVHRTSTNANMPTSRQLENRFLCITVQNPRWDMGVSSDARQPFSDA